jgi:RNA polymerase sigma-70 factor (ECF subfamily)
LPEQVAPRKPGAAATRDDVVRAQHGDHEAFERLAASAAGRLVGTAKLILRDSDAARDAVQETLIEVWRGLPMLRDPDAFEGWLQRILVRACHRAVRSNRRRAVEVPQLDMDMPNPSGERAVDDRDQIERAFRRLTTEQRAVLVLHHHLGLPLAESAGVLQIPTGTMKSRLNRATAALRAALEADEREGNALMGWPA